MKRFFLLLCVICGLYTFSAFSACGLSWAGNFGKSTEGTFSTVTFTHRTDCDSARVYFGYPSSNLYLSIKLFPLPADSAQLKRDSLDLDSIGGHYGEVRYYERGAGSVSGYVIGEWPHEDPTPGDTIRRDASTHGASDVATLWGDTLTLLIAFRDSINNATADANKGNFKADVSGLSTFDPATDTVSYVDSLIEELTITSVDSVRKVYIVDSLDQTVTADVDSPMIARAVHFATTSAYGGSTGTMGKAIVNAASCNPSGSNTIIIRLKRDSDSTAIIGGTVQVNTDETTVYYIGDTNNDGAVSFLSDNDTLFVYVDAHPITFTTPETLRIDGNEDVTYYGTPFDPGTPASANLCRVYGWVKDINDNPMVGVKVRMSITKGPVRYGNVPISRHYKTTKTNSSGYWYLDVYRTGDLTPSNRKYRVYIYIPQGEIVKRDVTVSGDTQEFTW